MRQDLPADRVLERTYDVAGNLLSEKEPRSHTTHHLYDTLDRRVRTTDPEPFAYQATTVYDDAGNIVRSINRRLDPELKVRRFTYDLRHRLEGSGGGASSSAPDGNSRAART